MRNFNVMHESFLSQYDTHDRSFWNIRQQKHLHMGVLKGVGLTPPLSLIFTKTLLPAQRKWIVLYFLLV